MDINSCINLIQNINKPIKLENVVGYFGYESVTNTSDINIATVQSMLNSNNAVYNITELDDCIHISEVK